jgi:hypothetical protein
MPLKTCASVGVMVELGMAAESWSSLFLQPFLKLSGGASSPQSKGIALSSLGGLA